MIPLIRKVILPVLLVQTIVSLHGQNYPSFSKYWEPITNALNAENYFEADGLISKALEYRQMTDTLNYLGGIASFRLNAYGRSEARFKKLVGTTFINRHPDVNYHLAEIMFATGRYTEAASLYKAYLPMTEPSGKESRLTENRISQVAWARENQNNKDPLVKIRRMENGVNTPENESGPFLHENALYYGTLRKKDPAKQTPESYQVKVLSVNESDGKPVERDSGLFSGDLRMGNPSFSPDHTRFIYTVVEKTEGTTRLRSSLYLKVFASGKWGEGIRLPEQVNLDNYSSTHGCIMQEGEGIYRIYYSSDRPEGKGGFDIWTVLINEAGYCTVPDNLDYINTEGDEYSPFYSRKSRTLFFSSNHLPGFGGFDVFRYSWKGRDSMRSVNLGRSVNSSFDEITYFTVPDESVAYLASNRPGSTYLDEGLQACCFDLYKVTSTPRTIDLAVTIRDAFDSLDIQGAKVMLFDVTSGDTLIASSEPLDRSIHQFKLTDGHQYRLLASKDSYLGDSIRISTDDLDTDGPIRRDLFLTQKKMLDIFTFEKTTNLALKGATVSVLDLDHDRLVGRFTNADSNSFGFPIFKGTNYLLIAAKPKYEPDTVRLTAMQTAMENPVRRNLYLELSAIAELRRLLPIRLFFDNDMPDPRSESDTTQVLFSRIYDTYTGRKSAYVKQYAEILKGAARSKAILAIDTFFNKEVKENGDKMLIFLDKLSIIMEEGHSIDIFLKGYASPRAKSDYNQHLSARRVTSIRNEFDYYDNGVFHPYIRSQSLKIKEIPYGESQASGDVSDSMEDVRNSVYSLKAAFERRVEILEILKGVDDTPDNK